MGNIVTLATSITVNSDESCTLTVANLETLISNAGDAYFADSANWANVRIEYRSSTGRQREMVVMTPASPSGIFKVSEKARQEQWNIEKIVISDFDGDFYVVKKADMAPTDYDEPTISAPVLSSNMLSPDFTETFDTVRDYWALNGTSSISGGVLNSGEINIGNNPDPTQMTYVGNEIYIDFSGTPFTGIVPNLVENYGYTNNYTNGDSLTMTFDIANYNAPTFVGTPSTSQTFAYLRSGDGDDAIGAVSSTSTVISGTGQYSVSISAADLATASNSSLISLRLCLVHQVDVAYTVTTDTGPDVQIDNVTITIS